MDMTTERPTAVHALYDGDRVYLITHSGLVSGEVFRCGSPGLCQVVVAEDMHHYRRGDIVMAEVSKLVHPDAIHGRHFPGGPRILGRTVYMGAR